MDLVLSYGDILRQSGYRTRVLGELIGIEKDSSLEPQLLAFDTQSGLEVPAELIGVPVRVRPRRIRQYYSEILNSGRQIQIVHAHNLYSAALALSTRRVFGYRVVLDLHGRIPEEYVFLGKGGPRSRTALNALERWTVTRSDHVIAVSHALRSYLLGAYAVDESHVSVIPCCADELRFRWDPDRRNAQRQRLGLDGRLVCVHLGSLKEWYRSSTIVEAFNGVRRFEDSAHLLVVTPDEDAAVRYLEERVPQNDFTVVRSKHSDVPGLLNASDLGLLLLPDAPNIRTSSPTKFSEYLNCGVPVLISPGVGDFSDVVERSGLGQVLGPDGVVDQRMLSEIQTSRYALAERCVQAGSALRWSSYRCTWDAAVCRARGQ